MALFEFTLKKLDATLKFNDCWSWFWLTDGSYNINLGTVKLFRYNKKTIQKWASLKKQRRIEQKQGIPYNEPDYYIVRLYEDLLDDVLPYTLESVSELAHQLLINPLALKRAREYWDDILELPNKNRDEQWKLYQNCSSGVMSGNLGGGYMLLPQTSIWRYQQNVYLYWDSTCVDEEYDDFFASSLQGIYIIPFEQFLAEVHDFHYRFMQAMEERIQKIKPYFIKQHNYSYDDLVKEHTSRMKSLERSLKSEIPKRYTEQFEEINQSVGINLKKILEESPKAKIKIFMHPAVPKNLAL